MKVLLPQSGRYADIEKHENELTVTLSDGRSGQVKVIEYKLEFEGFGGMIDHCSVFRSPKGEWINSMFTAFLCDLETAKESQEAIDTAGL